MDLPKIIKIARKKEVNVGVLIDKWQMTELNIKREIGQKNKC